MFFKHLYHLKWTMHIATYCTYLHIKTLTETNEHSAEYIVFTNEPHPSIRMEHMGFFFPLSKILRPDNGSALGLRGGLFFSAMDQIFIKTQIPKCRLYWCLIEFIDWRYSQSLWYFRPLLWTSAPLTFSLVHLSPPLPCVNKYSGTCIHTVCNKGGGRGSGPQTDKHLPPSTFTGNF